MSVRVPHCQESLLSLSGLLLKPIKTGRHWFASVWRQQDKPSICSCERQATARIVQTVVLLFVQVHYRYNHGEASLLYTSVCCTAGAGLQVLDCTPDSSNRALATLDKGWARALPLSALFRCCSACHSSVVSLSKEVAKKDCCGTYSCG